MRSLRLLSRNPATLMAVALTSLLLTATIAPSRAATRSGVSESLPTHRSSHSQNTESEGISPYSPGSNNLAIDIGQVFLMGDLSSKYQNAIGEQVHYTYGVSDLFGFDASAGYSSHSNGDFSMATALFGLRTNLSYYDKLVPYSIFGMGFYKPGYAYQGADGSQQSLSPILFGLHLGFGADLLVTNQVFFGAALTLHDVFGSDQTTSAGETISTGGTFMSFLLHAGMSF